MFADPAYQTKAWQAPGWNFAAPAAIRTLVLTANRVFTGSTIQDHPVRQAHEFINVIARGEIQTPIRSFASGKTIRCQGRCGPLPGWRWPRGEQFAAVDPINYANDFGARTLVFESWRFSVEKHHKFV